MEFTPTKEKIEAIAQDKVPQSVDELRTFIRIIEYYCKFIPDMSDFCAPLLLNASRGKVELEKRNAR